MPPARHFLMNDSPWDPKGWTSSEIQRAGFQQVLPTWHHSDFSVIRGAMAVPSPSRSVSQPWGNLFFGRAMATLGVVVVLVYAISIVFAVLFISY